MENISINSCVDKDFYRECVEANNYLIFSDSDVANLCK